MSHWVAKSWGLDHFQRMENKERASNRKTPLRSNFALHCSYNKRFTKLMILPLNWRYPAFLGYCTFLSSCQNLKCTYSPFPSNLKTLFSLHLTWKQRLRTFKIISYYLVRPSPSSQGIYELYLIIIWRHEKWESYVV